MSLPVTDTLDILRAHLKDASLLNAIAKDLIAAEKEIKDAKEPAAAKGATRLAVLIRGDAALQQAVAGGAWVVSVPDDDTTATYASDGLINRLRAAVTAHNEAPKGRRKAKARIQTWFQALTGLKAKVIKESGSVIGIKQKGTPCEVVVLTSETVEAP